MATKMLKIIISLLTNRCFYAIISVIGAYFFGYHNCYNSLQLKYDEQVLQLQNEAERIRNESEKKNQEITAKYMEERDNNDSLYSSNLELVKRLQQQSAPAGKTMQTNSNTKHIVSTTTNCRISERMARRITELARKADQLENYSKRCHEFVKSLNQ